MEATALRIRNGKAADPDFDRRTSRRLLWGVRAEEMPSPPSSPSGRGGQSALHSQVFSSPSGRGRREAAGEGELRSKPHAFGRILKLFFMVCLLIPSPSRADIPWPEV